MEDLLSTQQQLIGAIEQLYSNFKKDGPERKTGDYIRRRLETLDKYWEEFQNNHLKLCGYSDKSHDYFVTEQFDTTRERYEHVRSVIVNYQPRDAKPGTPLLRPATALAGAGPPQPPTRASSTAARTDSAHESEAHQVTFRTQGVNSRTDELLRKQASNFRALQRKVASINLDTELDKWEFDDLLKTLQFRWSAIDTLHLEIDSELEGKNQEYDAAFYHYERLYEDMKRAINRKMRSMCHREKSTPQMELPIFSGSFQQWTSFKDLFTETIHTNASLSYAQKMQFLKGKLRGEAERLVQHLQISSDNYVTCWEILNNRYNNKKLIFTSHVNTLMNISVSQQPSFGHIKKIHDTSLESLNAIKNLGVDISSWDPLLVHILSQKLDADTYNEYISSLKQPKELPILKDFLNYLETKFTALETSRKKQENPTAKSSFKNTYYNNSPTENRLNYKKPTYFTQSKVSSNRVQKPAHTAKLPCHFCSNREHGLYYCTKFLELPNHMKRKFIIDKNLCKNCLYDHEGKNCYSESRCRECDGNHNTISHDVFCNKVFTSKNTESKISKSDVGNTHVSVNCKDPEILLATAMVQVQARDGTYYNIRALLDQGSETTLISERIAHILGLPRKHCKGTITGIGEKESNCKGIIKIKCRSNQEDFSFETDAYIMRTLIKNLPSYSFPKPEWPALENLPLADPYFNMRRPVDLLLGVDVFSNLLLDGIYKAGPTLPMAQKTRLGWILSGCVKKSFKCNIIVHNIDDICQFWQSENISEPSTISLADQQVIDFYNKSTIRQSDGKYQQLGHMIHSNNSDSSGFYLPHHCVIRDESTTTKLRVVFNASAPSTSGLSLNDLMERGPNLQQDLQSLLIKWRQFRYGFTADIEKMFRMVWLHPDDQKYQKIIWRESPLDKMNIFQLKTVTYGTKAAPFLAMMTLRRLAQDERQNYQESSAPKVIESSFYMDDLVYGCHSIESAKRLINDIISILNSGGFNLRKWKANNQDILPNNYSNTEQINYDFKNTESSKTLGLSWDPQQDQFTFTSKLDFMTKNPTKRILLSNISKLFDPLGWLSPISTKIKLLFQQVWQLQLKWDEPLPENILKEWESMKIDLENINKFYIPRWLGTIKNNVIELHGFSDASTKCYACVVYCKVMTHEQTSVTMIAGKSRLVPVNNKLTLPKLELCGALLLIKLLSKIKSCLETYQINYYCWVDSMVVLGWINGVPERWKPFVANRVKQIIEVVPPNSWNYVKSEENPADCASRGLTALQLRDHKLWWNGPTWLKTHKTKDQFNTKITFFTCQEAKRTKKIVATCQQEYFIQELRDIQKGNNVSSKSKICMLHPILDEDKILRVGGRLKHANINLDMKHPIIIPKNSRLSELIIDQCHELTYHGGAKLTSGFIRQKYWLVRGLKATKKRIFQCVKCRKHTPSQHYQIMGDLPTARVNPSRPFYHTGVDYTGHVFVKANKGRGILTTKGYVAVFVCMVTKAVHLELVSDLTTSSFLAALRRMTARRGVPKNMYSDQGTTFIGANKVLQEEYQQILSTFQNTKFIDEITRMGIKWHFNAPSWPSAGGLWEAAVKSLKYHIKRVIGEQRLTFEEYSTLLSQLEACINQRPLCAMTEDPDDLNCLTPSHFLTNGPHLAFYNTETDLRTRWHLTQRLFDDIWKKWRLEYLTQLSVRSKWRLPQENIKINDINWSSKKSAHLRFYR
ncbi:uncharacterized protein LOC123666892 [Melitaea cinxia]|uniref:uncharacterized protein LOC123666892 n=1 Tax=Melitaea cinxia TaxID=113334 RepID=UPI001E2726D2|nr:uncharacterized protein LOC123666892 [Melitaea cinxia]